MTAIVAEFRDGTVTLANCGHHEPLLVNGPKAALVETGDPSLPLGLGAEPTLVQHAWPLGARLLFSTDGLVESRDARGAFFPLDGYGDQLAQGALEVALDRLVGQLLSFSGDRLDDDMVLVLAENKAAPIKAG